MPQPAGRDGRPLECPRGFRDQFSSPPKINHSRYRCCPGSSLRRREPALPDCGCPPNAGTAASIPGGCCFEDAQWIELQRFGQQFPKTNSRWSVHAPSPDFDTGLPSLREFQCRRSCPRSFSSHPTRNYFLLPCSTPQGPSARPPAARRHENFHEDADTVDGWRKVFKCILKCSNTSACIADDSKIKWSTPLLKSHPVYSQGFVGSTIQLANDGDPRDIWNG